MWISTDGSNHDISLVSGRRENGVKHIYGLDLLTPTSLKICTPDLLREDTPTSLNRTFCAGKSRLVHHINSINGIIDMARAAKSQINWVAIVVLTAATVRASTRCQSRSCKSHKYARTFQWQFKHHLDRLRPRIRSVLTAVTAVKFQWRLCPSINFHNADRSHWARSPCRCRNLAAQIKYEVHSARDLLHILTLII